MRYDDTLGWIITLDEWQRCGLTMAAYNKLRGTYRLDVVARASKGRKAEIVVGSLPDYYRSLIEQRLVQLRDDHASLMADAKLHNSNLTECAIRVTANTLTVNAPYIRAELISYVNAQYNQYVSHYLQSYNLNRRSIIGYAKLCALAMWVYNMVSLIRSRYPDDKDYNRQMRSFRANFSEAMDGIANNFEILPPLSRRLDEWIDMVVTKLSEGKLVTDIITVKRAGNKNSQVLTPEQRLVIDKLYMDPMALSIMEIYQKLLETGRMMGWWKDNDGRFDQPSYGTVRNYIVSRKNVLSLSRTSEADFRNQILPTINRTYPTLKNMVWGIDGTAQNEYVHYRGKIRQYAYAVTVYDYATFYLLDVTITLAGETDADMIQAIKSAIREAGYKPEAIQCDQGPGYTGLKQWCEANGIKVIPAGLGVARAKPVELLIGLKDRLIDRFNASWSGANRTATGANSHPGDQHVKNAQRNARDFAIAQRSLRGEVMQQWNHYIIDTREGKPCGKTPTELWNAAESATPKLDYINLCLLTGHKHTVKLTIDGLTVQNNNQTYTYFPALDTAEAIEQAIEAFSQIPRRGHREGSQMDIYVIEYGKPALVMKDNKCYGLWALKPKADMFATLTKETENYKLLRRFQELLVSYAKETIQQVDEQYQVQAFAPVVDQLKHTPLVGRKRVTPRLDKSALNADEIMAKSGQETPEAIETIANEITEYETVEFTNELTGEIITIKRPKQ